METYQEFANRYLAAHPGAVRWRTLDSTAQNGALELAAEDIAAYLGASSPDRSDKTHMAAVCEQALWILEKAARPDPTLASEKIDGVGSRSYRAVSGGNSFLAERAIALLAPQLRRAIGRIARG